MEVVYKDGKCYLDKQPLICEFFQDQHEYWLGYWESDDYGDETFIQVKKLISVTTLMSKHNLSTNYANVNASVLRAKAERGTMIHKELEDYVKNGDVGFTKELDEFVNLCAEQSIEPKQTEFIVYNDVVAGTIDTAGTIHGFTYIGDYKTTSQYHAYAVSWQLSLYEYLSGITFDKLLCFHFSDGLKMYEVQRRTTDEIEQLINCERQGETYEVVENSVNLQNDLCKQLKEVREYLQWIDEQKKQYEEKQEKMKRLIIEQMEANSVKQIENDLFKITYVAPRVQTGFDKDKFKTEQPDLFEKYNTKKTDYKASLRITLKGEKENV